MKKKILALGIIIFLLLVCGMCAGYYDGARVTTGHEPKLAVKTYSEKNDAVTYWGLGYKVVRYIAMSPKEPYDHNVGVKMGSWFMKYEKPTEKEIFAEILETGEIMQVKNIHDMFALSDCLENQKYSEEVCEGITDYKITIDDEVYAVKSRCLGVVYDGKEARITQEDMDRLLKILEHTKELQLTIPSEEWTEVQQSGANGTIMLSLPEGWEYEACSKDSDEIGNVEYGLRFHPQGAAEGYVEVGYTESFGVCGTGLESEEITLADAKAYVGTYDEHAYWDFISFEGKNAHIAALTVSVEEWWPEYGDQVMEILDTLKFEREFEESELKHWGLSLEMKNVTPTGATLVFHQSGGNLKGSLETVEDFVLTRHEGEAWKSVPVIVEGDYGFQDIAYSIAKESATELEVDWEWLYGKLEPGEYRLGKRVFDFRETGYWDEAFISGYFVLE